MSEPQSTTVSHDGESVDCVRARVLRWAPADLSHVVDRRQEQDATAEAHGGRLARGPLRPKTRVRAQPGPTDLSHAVMIRLFVADWVSYPHVPAT